MRRRITIGLYKSLVIICAVIVSCLTGCANWTKAEELNTKMHQTLSEAYLMDVVHKELLTGTDYGGELYAFFVDGEVQIITARVGLSTKTAIWTFFYSQNTLYAAIEEEAFHRVLESGDEIDFHPQILNPFSRRVYLLSNGQVIGVKDTGIILDSPDTHSARLIKRSDYYMECVKSKRDALNVESFIKEGDTTSPDEK